MKKENETKLLKEQIEDLVRDFLIGKDCKFNISFKQQSFYDDNDKILTKDNIEIVIFKTIEL